MLKLPDERATQLKALASAMGVGVTEAIEILINEQIAKGILPDELPGFDIYPANRQVHFTTPTFALPALAPQHAREVADVIEAVAFADGKAVGKALTLPDGSKFTVYRKGRGIILGYEVRKLRTVSVTPRMARDLVRQIRRAADGKN